MNWIFVDLDMTMIDTRDLVISGGPEPTPGTPEHDTWVSTVTDFETVRRAKAVESMLMLVYNLKSPVVFITNRRQKMSTVTLDWLKRHNLRSLLVMRPDDCLDRAGDFKASRIRLLVSPGDTVTVIDDDPDGSIERVCRINGWTHLKVTTYPSTKDTHD